MLTSSDVHVKTQERLRWARLDTQDKAAERNLKLILGEQDFRALATQDIQGVQSGYYRGFDGRGNVITVRVIADAA